MSENSLQNLAKSLTTQEKTARGKVERLYQFVKEEIKYKFTFRGDPQKILELGYGSCFDKAILFSELLKSIGIKSCYHLILVDINLLAKKFFRVLPILFRLKTSFSFHVFNKVYLEGVWEELDTAFDSEIEKYFQEKKIISRRRSCGLAKEYILEDLGSFENPSDIFETPFFLQLVNQSSSSKKEIEFAINFFNRLLYQKREKKTTGLKEKEIVKNILININRLKGK